ncbi:MAG: copper resistance protein NlpE [Fibromonadaceae bacterium]|jgi:hypothetical protein|nr:copper resistance protein NlpE [Fibromonadaceae bacterium]
MKSNLTKFALSAALALALTFTLSCSGGGDSGGDNPANNSTPGNNNNGGGINRDSRLVNASGEAWLVGSSCESADDGVVFKSNGDFRELNSNDDGTWREKGSNTWRTDGSKIILTNARGEDKNENFPYEISDGSLILTDSGRRVTHKKCSVVIVGG